MQLQRVNSEGTRGRGYKCSTVAHACFDQGVAAPIRMRLMQSRSTCIPTQQGLACTTAGPQSVTCAHHRVPQIDFISLSFVREADDLAAAREFLDSVGASTTKVRLLLSGGCCLHSRKHHSA